MRSITVRRFWGLKNAATGLACLGIIGGMVIDSMGGFLSSLLLLFVVNHLIQKAWVYGASNSYIVSEGVIVVQINEACYISRSALSKEFVNIHILEDVAMVDAELYIYSSAYGGSILPLEITIGYTVGSSHEAISLYYRYFIEGKNNGKDYTYALLNRFQHTQEFELCAFGDAYVKQVGTEDWIKHVFSKRLFDFMEKEAALAGLRVKAVGVIAGDETKSVLLKRKEE